MAQSTIDFLLNNNIAIIQTVFVIIFALVVVVILRSFKQDKEEHIPPRPSTIRERREAASTEAPAKAAEASAKAEAMPSESSPLDDLDNLDDLMGPEVVEASQAQIDQTLSKPSEPEVNIPPPADFEAAAKAAGATGPDPVAAPAAPSGDLASALSEKEKVIADLKSEIKSLQEKAPAAGGDTAALEGKIKELTEKLSEYEIIEDDIANLSFYKNENAKLKNELEKLRGVSGSQIEAAVAADTTAAAAPAATAPTADPAPTPPPSAEAPAKAEATPPPVETPAPAAPVPSAAEADDILNEFEEAVKQKEALEKNLPQAESAPIAVSSEDTDLLKEFESAVEKELAPAAAAAAPAATAPAADPAPTAAPAPAAEPPSAEAPAKAEEINSDKLVQEVENLASTKPPEVPDDGKDSNQKLIEEFENFMNKS